MSVSEPMLYIGPDGWGPAYPGDAGVDLPITVEQILSPGQFADIPSGIKVAIPHGYYGRIIGRSSALRKRHIKVHEGIIDAGFRGELYSYVENVGQTATVLQPGDRVAQLILCPVPDIEPQQRVALPPSARGENGFGSSDRPMRVEDQGRVDPSKASFPVATIVRPERHYIAGSPDEPSAAIVRENLPRPLVYLGGPIDGEEDRSWVTSLQREVATPGHVVHASWYDPLRENAGEPDPRVIYHRNMEKLREADIAFFHFGEHKGHYGFGSPIEIHERMNMGYSPNNPHHRTIVWHRGSDVGVYLRYYWYDGLLVTDDWNEAVKLVRDAIAAIDA